MVSRKVVRLAAEIAARKPLSGKGGRGYIVMRHKNEDGISVVDKVSIPEVNRLLKEAWDKALENGKVEERATV